MKEKKYVATAFLSCSLRPEDIQFVEYVSRILRAHNINPVGTAGKYYAAPENPTESMKRNIEDYDFLVVAATPRYFSRDIHKNKSSKSISEQLHAEAGIAKGLNKPVIAFIQEGADPGNFISQITQYVILNGTAQDYNSKNQIIYSLLNNTYKVIQEMKGAKMLNTIGSVAIGGLAVLGFVKLMELLSNEK